MKEQENTKEQLISELAELRQRITELETSKTEHKRAEEALRESEERFRLAFEDAPIGMAIVGLDYRLLKVNRALYEMLGYTVQELTALTLVDVTHSEDIGKEVLLAEQMFKGEIPEYKLEKRYIKKNQEVMWVDLTATVIRDQDGKALYGLAMIEDITERKRAEEALQESEERFRRMADNIQDGLTIIEQGKVVYVNNRACEIFGYPKDELVKLTGLDVATPEEKERLQRIEEEAEKTSVRPKELEFWITRKDGTRRCIRNRYSVSLKDGRIAGRYVVTTDITQRKRAEEALRESEEKYHSIFETAANLITSVSGEGTIVDCNSRIQEVLGYESDEIIGQPMAKIIHPDYLAKAQDSLKEILTKGFSYNKEYKMVRKDGTLIDVSINSAGLRDEKGEFVRTICIIDDITQRKRAEEEKERLQTQLLQAQKMEAIGILSSGVAHDFNNLLGAIQGYTELAMEVVDEADPLYDDLKRINLVAERGAYPIRQLLLFSRNQPMEPISLNINSTVDGLLEVLNHFIGEEIAINIDLEPDLWAVRADEACIEQVIMNLVGNAREAMPKGGDLTIKTENVTLDKEHCKGIPEAQTGRFVRLSVADTGVGMDEEIMQHIFEPFFTTKEVGKGVGLGLPVAYGVVKQHEGWINVYSEPGTGSTFQVFLPTLAIKPDEETEETISL